MRKILIFWDLIFCWLTIKRTANVSHYRCYILSKAWCTKINHCLNFMHLKFSGMKWVELICMTYLWTHIHFCYPKPFHSCFCRFVPRHNLPSEPKMFFFSVVRPLPGPSGRSTSGGTYLFAASLSQYQKHRGLVWLPCIISWPWCITGQTLV